MLLLCTTSCQEDEPLTTAGAIRQAQASSAPAPDLGSEEGAAPCGELELLGSPVLPEEVKGAPPNASGGPIEDGVYHVVAHHVFGDLPGRDNVPFHQSITVKDSATRLEMARRRPTGELFHGRFGLEVEDENLHLEATCPAELVGTTRVLPYSFASGDLTIHQTRVDGTSAATVYRRQGSETP